VGPLVMGYLAGRTHSLRQVVVPGGQPFRVGVADAGVGAKQHPSTHDRLRGRTDRNTNYF